MSTVDRDVRRKYNEKLEDMSPEDAIALATRDLFELAKKSGIDLELFEEQLQSFTIGVSRAEEGRVRYGVIVSIIAHVGMEFIGKK